MKNLNEFFMDRHHPVGRTDNISGFQLALNDRF